MPQSTIKLLYYMHWWNLADDNCWAIEKLDVLLRLQQFMLMDKEYSVKFLNNGGNETIKALLETWGNVQLILTSSQGCC